MAIFFHFLTTSNHLHPLQVENCDSNSRLVVDGDDKGKVRLERVKVMIDVFNLAICFSNNKFRCTHQASAHCKFDAGPASQIISKKFIL